MKCEYAKTCGFYQSSSFTCTRDGGGPYCGEWRKREDAKGGKPEVSVIDRALGWLGWGKGFSEDIRSARLRSLDKRITRKLEEYDDLMYRVEKTQLELMQLHEDRRRQAPREDGFKVESSDGGKHAGR